MKLTDYENAIFALLESNVGGSVQRSTLESALRLVRPTGSVPPENSNVLEVLIGRIRRKLPKGSTIKAVRGVGYQFRVVALCDSCQNNPGTHYIMVAAGTQTFVCGNCSPYSAKTIQSATKAIQS